MPILPFLAVFLALPSISGDYGGLDRPEWEGNVPRNTPYFDESHIGEAVTSVGKTAYLPCSVYNLGDKVVSWVRSRDLHILTADIFTYTSDDRFVVLHPQGSKDWTLQINFPQTRDSGRYECQVSTEPKIAYYITLRVLDGPLQVVRNPKTKMKVSRKKQHNRGRVRKLKSSIFIQKPELHVGERSSLMTGENLVLLCTLEGPHVSSVLWQKDGKFLDLSALIGGMSIKTEVHESAAVSQLIIVNVSLTDAGEYKCSAAGGEEDTVQITVDDFQGTSRQLKQLPSSASSIASHTCWILIAIFLMK